MKTETIILVGVAVVGVIVLVKVLQPTQPTGPNWAGIGTGIGNVIGSIGGLFKSKTETASDDSELHY